jgi:hypothetical protein
MVEFGGRIGVEDCLLVVPVALGDVSNVQNARCVTTTLDLEKIFMVISSLLVVSDYCDTRTIFICLSGVNPCEKLESRFHPSTYSMRRPDKIVPSGSVNCQRRVSK